MWTSNTFDNVLKLDFDEFDFWNLKGDKKGNKRTMINNLTKSIWTINIISNFWMLHFHYLFEINALVRNHCKECLQTIWDLSRHATIVSIPINYINLNTCLITFTIHLFSLLRMHDEVFETCSLNNLFTFNAG